MKHFLTLTTIFMLIIASWVIHANVQENKESPKLSDEQKRFDLNNDGTLSPEENDLMLRVTGL